MTRFTPAKGLQAKVARLLVAPALAQVAESAAEGARNAAPPNKVWVTVADERVRRTHQQAHNQARPENLRFSLRSPDYGQETNGSQWELGIQPGDEIGFSAGNTVNCRCKAFLGSAEGSLASKIDAERVKVAGPMVTAGATCTHPLCVNAEFGNSVDHGARFMAAGLRAARRRLR